MNKEAVDKRSSEPCHEWWHVALFVVFGVAVIGIVWMLMQPLAYDRSRDEAEQDAEAREIISVLLLDEKDVCSPAEGKVDQDACNRSGKAIERYLGRRDLAAQETVAKATRGMLWVAAAQGAVAMATLALLALAVYQTSRLLKEAGDTTAAATKTVRDAENTQRAHVFVELEADYAKPITHERYKVKAKLINYGQTPATDVRYEISPVIMVGDRWQIFRHGDDCGRPSANGSLELIGLREDARTRDLEHELGDVELSLLGVGGSIDHERYHVEWSYVDIFDEPHGPYSYVARSDAVFKSTYKNWDPSNPDFSEIKEIRFVRDSDVKALIG